MTITILFFRSTGWSYLFGLLIRLCTRQSGQRLRDVPSHVAIQVIWPSPKQAPLTREWDVYQMVCRGISRQRNHPIGYMRGRLMYSVPVTIANPQAVEDFCLAVYERRARYDWWAILCDVLSMCLPRFVALQDTDTRRYDCSRFVACALGAGGYPMVETREPISPNDLLLALKKPAE